MGGFLIGFPEDTEESIQRVRLYAQDLNPTYANFNVVTPYPGTAFYERMRPQIEDADLSHYTVYTPVLKYQHLTRRRMEELVAKCFHRYYFRWAYVRENASLLWPALRKLGLGGGRFALIRPPSRSRSCRRRISASRTPAARRFAPTARIAAERHKWQDITVRNSPRGHGGHGAEHKGKPRMEQR